MPKISKIKPKSVKPGAQDIRPGQKPTFLCTRCGLVFGAQSGFFAKSRSPLFSANNGYFTVCLECMEMMFQHYTTVLGEEDAAIRRMCAKFDMYWHRSLLEPARADLARGRYKKLLMAYMNALQKSTHAGKTYDHTLQEDLEELRQTQEERKKRDGTTLVEYTDTIRVEDVEFWGEGYTAYEYALLNRKYDQWVASAPSEVDENGHPPIGTSTLYKQICTLEMQINRNIVAGKNTESAIKQLNDLIGSVKAKPGQTKDESDIAFDNLSFGQGIRILENTRPVPKPLPQLEDVDGIVRYINIWFLGHLCKMLHIKNTYCQMYEDEIERLRVERPELEGEDDEAVFNDIFGDDHS